MTDLQQPLRTFDDPQVADRIRGCLLGGAVGDAVGAPAEFMTLAQIRQRYGPGGIDGMAFAYGRTGAFTDDTQMTLFTAEGLIRAAIRGRERGICHPPSVVDHAYARWLTTQGQRSTRWKPASEGEPDGWLVKVPGLHARRAPGDTCLSALLGDRQGSIEGEPLNNSKGCGGVMRVAPAGLFALWNGSPFEHGAQIAALTHSHPSGYLSAGALAELLFQIVWRDEPLEHALALTRARLESEPKHEETSALLDRVVALAAAGPPAAEVVESLGGGWVGEEALAIAVYCALVAPNYRDGVLLASNHSGDSDSTAAITGNILAAIHGSRAIPTSWLASLEIRETVEEVIDDFIAIQRLFSSDGGEPYGGEFDRWWERYPGW